MESKPSFWRILTRERSIDRLEKTEGIVRTFSATEKTLFIICAVIFAIGAFSLLAKVSSHFTVGIPLRGGSLTEGVVGTPRFVNPLLAVSDADRDLTALVYSGLLKATPDGNFAPDLAESYSVSPDGLTYSFVIRKNAVFHDGTPVTAEDVEFTVKRAQDAGLKSPRRVSWEGVSVEVKGERELSFTLKQPYAPFVTNLTMGILPKHVWQSLDNDQMPFSSLNINPIGTGPYRVSSVKRTGDGIPSEFVLKSNPKYALGEPYIKTFDFKFYPNEKALVAALKSGAIESASNLAPASAKELNQSNVISAPLTRVFGVFFNQNENEVLAHKEVRKALDAAIDKESIIKNVLLGFASEADGPLPPTVAQVAQATTTATSTKAFDALAKAGWKKDAAGTLGLKVKTGTTTLALSLSTANVPELVESARRIETAWTNMGAKVDVRVFEPTDLNQGVIRPRKYDALLFGLVIGKNSDLYPFWHSSQRNDPGLNVALYTNAKADKLLDLMRKATSTEARKDEYAQLKTEIDADTPAIFLWSPDYIYAVPDKLHGVALGEITTPSDRFIGVEKWYVATDRVWNIFARNNKDTISN